MSSVCLLDGLGEIFMNWGKISQIISDKCFSKHFEGKFLQLAIGS